MVASCRPDCVTIALTTVCPAFEQCACRLTEADVGYRSLVHCSLCELTLKISLGSSKRTVPSLLLVYPRPYEQLNTPDLRILSFDRVFIRRVSASMPRREMSNFFIVVVCLSIYRRITWWLRVPVAFLMSLNSCDCRLVTDWCPLQRFSSRSPEGMMDL